MKVLDTPLVPELAQTSNHQTPEGESQIVDDLLIVSLVSTCEPIDETQAEVISYAVCVLHQGQQLTEVFYPPAGDRLTIEDVLERTKAATLASGLVTQWPEQFVLAGHWTASTLRCFKDWDQLKSKFPRKKSSFVTGAHPVRLGAGDKFRVDLRDVIPLAPNGHESLEEIAKYLKLHRPKVPLRYWKKWKDWAASDRPGYERFVTADAEVIANYIFFVAKLFERLPRSARDCPVPGTIGTVAVKSILDGWKKSDVDVHTVIGTVKVNKPSWSSKSKRPTRKIEVVPIPILLVNETLAVEANHGARNEVYFYGPTQEDDWFDYDFNSAYPTILDYLGTPLWDQLRMTNNPKDFTPDVLGATLVSFHFPAKTRYPVIPVRIDTGLIFPRCGTNVYATSPEIALAVKLGANVTIHQGFVIPMSRTSRPFEPYMKLMLGSRDKSAKGSLANRLYKGLGERDLRKARSRPRRKEGP